MNPAKVVAPNRLDNQLRLGTAYEPMAVHTFFSYPEDGGSFSKATLRCVAVGKCRSSSSDEHVMCPSYMVTREEEHSTRGRARLLFEMVRGDVIADGWRSTAVRDALDLCLACKGCKSDCPVNVDMATYKVEFLAHHYAGRLRPLSHYSMGWLPVAARLAGRAPQLVNAVTSAPGLGRLVKAAAGVDQRRGLPLFAGEPFTAWWRRRAQEPSNGHGAAAGTRGPVILWPDTFSTFFHPSVGRSAVEVLEAAGFDVRVPDRAVCCGLTWISTGQLATARRVLRRTLDVLRDDIRAGVPVVGLEPSCTAVFRADGPELLAGDEDMRRLSTQTRTLAELLRERAGDWDPPRLQMNAIMQTHCHQHAVLGAHPEGSTSTSTPLRASSSTSGCAPSTAC